MSLGVELAERGWLPDWIVRRGVRRLLESRLDQERAPDERTRRERLERFVEGLAESPIAIAAPEANEQHYEVPAEFFATVLGPWKKYSCCLWDEAGANPGDARPDAADAPDAPDSDDGALRAAEEAMLRLTCERAGLKDGMRVLDLGCGWGSLSLWIAKNYPACRVTALSNSHGQRASIEADARRLGLNGRTVPAVETGNVAEWDTTERFDRVLSVEMFEHMRNLGALLKKISGWLERDGRLFVHHFSHARYAYTFEVEPSSWMGSEFFSGGMMPSDDLLSRFPGQFTVESHDIVDGTHYARTLRAWLDRLDERRDFALEIFRRTYGERNAARHLQRWRVFFLGCEESFGYRSGREWRVSHVRLAPSA